MQKNISLILYSIALFFFMNAVAIGQSFEESKINKKTKERIPDNPFGRAEYEYQMLIDPQTGEVPRGIEVGELQYVNSSSANLRGKQNRAGSPVWIRRGPFNIGGRTRALALDKVNENIILAGGVSGGLWRSTDAGETWEKVTSVTTRANITYIAQDTRVGYTNTWYFVTGELPGNSASGGSAAYRGVGVYKSTDNGITWTLLASTNADPTVFGSGDFQYNWKVIVNPTNGDVYVASYRGIFRSTDGGLSWSRVLNGEINASTNETDVACTTNGIFYATLGSNSTNQKGIFRSTDGINWIDITPSSLPSNYNRIVLDIAPSNENIVYFFAATPASGVGKNDNNKFSFFKYTYINGDGSGSGGNWENRTSNLPSYGGDVGDLNQANYNQVLKVKPSDENFVIIGTTNLYSSSNAFATNTQTAWIGGYAVANDVSRYPNQHPDQHSLVFLPSNANKVITGHDGGLSLTEDISRTGDGNVVWKELNNGYFTTQAYTVGIDEVTAGDNRMMAGFQDRSKWTTTTGASEANWLEELGGGDGAYVAIVSGENTRYTSVQRGIVTRFKGANPEKPTKEDGINPSNAEGQLFIHPFILDPDDANKMYYPARNGSSGFQGIWRNTNLNGINNNSRFSGTSTNWEFLTNSTIADGTSITSLAASKGSNELYYGTSNGQVYKITNRNVTEASINKVDIYTGKGMPSGYVSAITVDPSDANNVFLVFSNYQVKSIWYSNDKGDNWTDISGNLEQNSDGSGNGPSIRWIAVNAPTTGTKGYFVGTSTGLYYTENLNGTSTLWQQQASDLIGNKVVSMIKTRQSDGLVAVATHANGLYSAYYGITDHPPLVAKQIGKVTAYQDDQATVIDISKTFTDLDNDDANISLAIQNNSNASLVIPSIAGGKLSLTYQSGQTGEAYITLRATSNSKTVDEIIHIEVNPIPIPIIYSQTSNIASNSISQIFPDNSNAILENADDLIVPVGQSWNITIVQVSGQVTNAEPTQARVIIYDDNAGTPGTEAYNSGVVSAVYANNILTVDLSSDPINLSSGTYWISVPAVMNLSPGNSRFQINTRNPAIGANRKRRDPTGFTSGSWPTNWESASGDLAYLVYGSGMGLPAVNSPSSLNATAASSSQVKLTWTDNSTNENTFEIEGSTTAGSGFSKIATVGENTTEWVDNTGLTTGTTYYYRIRANGASGNSSYSNEASAKPDNIPTAPSALSATQNNDAVNLTWTDNSNNETGFDILRTTVSGKGYAKIGNATSGVTNYTDNVGFINGVTYYYVVRATAPQGNSALSNEANLTISNLSEAPIITTFSPSSGDVGTVVSISGGNFSAIASNNEVKFNGIAANISNATASNITTTVPIGATTGKITVTVNGQTGTSDLDFTVTNGASVTSLENALEESLELFPNPASEYFTIRLKTETPQEVVVKLFDLEGMEISSQILAYSGEALQATFYTENLPKGIYVLKLILASQVLERKVLIQ